MIGQDAAKSFAYILGVYLGDGCVAPKQHVGNRHPVFRLNTIDQDFAEAVLREWLELTGKVGALSCHYVSKSSKPNWAFGSRHDATTARLMADSEDKRLIPAYVFDWSRNLKLAFVGGIMDSEGFVAANSNHTGRRFYMGFKSCDRWVPDFIRLLQSVGIEIGKVGIEKPRQAHYKTPMRFAIKMQSWIDSGARFNIARKQARVDEWAATEPHPLGLNFRAKLSSETLCQAPAKAG